MSNERILSSPISNFSCRTRDAITIASEYYVTFQVIHLTLRKRTIRTDSIRTMPDVYNMLLESIPKAVRLRVNTVTILALCFGNSLTCNVAHPIFTKRSDHTGMILDYWHQYGVEISYAKIGP